MNMTTLEAIQFLLDNPDEMIRGINNCLYARNENGTIYSCTDDGQNYYAFELCKVKLDTRWEVVKKPPKQVSWQEAIQAWSKSKNFYIEVNGNRYTQCYYHTLGTLADCSGNPQGGIPRYMLTQGKWYILD